MQGIFDLKSPKDMLAKLNRELERLRTDPNNVDHAFNFFVTAEHMLDWLYPGYPAEKTRRKIRDAEIILEVVSHLASGAKHFDQLAKHHQTVKDAGPKGGYFGSNHFGSRHWRASFFGRTLRVILDGPAKASLGESVTALELAEKVYTYWSTPGRI
jgi:hypothetical protein